MSSSITNSISNTNCLCGNIDNNIFCKKCNKGMCELCFKELLVTNRFFPKCMTCCNTETCTFLHCMHCEIEISEEVITNNTTEEWRNKQFAKKNNTIAPDSEPESDSESESKIDKIFETISITNSNPVSLVNSKTSTEEEETTDCPICCNTMTKSETITCDYCQNDSCRECFQRFLLDSDKPKCMHCNVSLNIETILLKSDKSWFSSEYKSYRKVQLMKIEKGKFQSTQLAANAYSKAQTCKHTTCLNGLLDNFDPYFGRFLNNRQWERAKRAERIVINAIVCIQQFGRGWEDFDFESGEPRRIESLKRVDFACPVNGCHGFVSESECNMCNSKICDDCHEPINKTTVHFCNPDTVSSIKAIFKEARPCPKCAALISKIEGCDQMFCTQCHTTYSWNTSAVVDEGAWHHNPHYVQWVKDNTKKIPVKIGEVNCEEFISYENLLTCFSQEILMNYKITRNKLPSTSDLFAPLPSQTHYLISFLSFHKDILNIRGTSGNHANLRPIDNHPLRVKFMTGEINEEEFINTLEKDDFEYYKHMSYWYIYLMVFNTAAILFDNLYAYQIGKAKIKKKKPEDFMFDIYFQLQKTLEYANNVITYNDKAFGVDERFKKFKRNPY